MAITVNSKAPGERIGYLWTPPLADGDTITGLPTIVLVSGTATSDGVSLVGTTQVKVFLFSGDDGETSQFLCEVDTVGGETLQETIYLPVNSTALSPLAEKLVQIFPEFSQVPTAQLDYWAGRAEIEAAWADEHGKMLLAAHMMALNGLGENASMQGVTSFKSGTVDMTFSDSQASGFEATSYGIQFAKIVRTTRGAPLLVCG